MDITELTEINEESFSCIFDKGTFDCVTCSESDTNRKIEAMMNNIYRILTPGGTFLCVSRGPPETRLHFLQNQTTLLWDVEVQKIQKKSLA